MEKYSEKFVKDKNFTIVSKLPLKFERFHSDPKTGSGFGEMGNCWREKVINPKPQIIANISLNRLYLLNKFGCDKYFTSNPKASDDYTYIDISFSGMLETCSHELAHYIQLARWGISSCESDRILNNSKYDKELAKEHEEWTEEIYQLIKPEISEWEKRWREIK